VLILIPVVEAPFEPREFWSTGLAPQRRETTWIELSGACPTADVERVLFQLAAYNSKRSGEVLSPVELLRSRDRLVLPGGLLARAPPVPDIAPSCCCGLESWPEWRRIEDGHSPWLGHDPAPGVEPYADGYRLWPDGDLQGRTPIGEAITFDAAELAQQLQQVESALRAFTLRLAEVASAHVPEHAAALGALFANAFGGHQEA
jgi:hypothetical protein